MGRVTPIIKDPLLRWSIADALETYHINRWGCGFVDIAPDGHLLMTPRGPDGGSIDMKALIDELTQRGIQLPILLRFSDILRSRIELLNTAFATAMADFGYTGSYRGVYPIKVNQSRKVVEEVMAFGEQYNYGLEAGSKPELLAVMAIHDNPDALIVCNGYKDSEYIETALLASRLGRKVILVVEKPSEVDLIYQVSQAMNIAPTYGLRARLSSRGSGHWKQSGGERSKFGLSASDMVEAVSKLRAWNHLEHLQLLHFHLGSQISAIRSIKNAIREAGRFYVELYKMGCKSLQFFDVGGGLGVDYDGSQTNFASSMNYTIQEYANDVVYILQEICDASQVPHPTVVTESGRAVAAHHSVLVVEVLGISEMTTGSIPDKVPKGANPLVGYLFESYELANTKNLLETYHDAVEYKDQVLQLFNLGHLSLEERVTCEHLFWGIIERILGYMSGLSHIPEELQGLEKTLCDTYFCNFSTFQSLPDAWAVDQLFPIVPIHRLHEAPTRRAILADITCDSDGKIDSFIGLRDVKKSLELHTKNGEDYYLGMFLVGAYQEILGDMHNLFGDTNTVHVSLDGEGNYYIDEVVAGDTVEEVLRYVDYQSDDLTRRLRAKIEISLRNGQLDLSEARKLITRFREGMMSYTYLG